MNKNKIIHWFIISTFVLLYFAVSLISMIHVVSFFELTNPKWLAISLSVAFEIGAMASLCSIIILEKMNKTIIWTLFWALTLMQAMGNSYYCFVNLEEYQGWIELFGLTEEEPLFQKRILSVISGAILPLIALGFIKSLVDYLKPNKETNDNISLKEIEHSLDEVKTTDIKENEPVEQKIYDSMSEDDKKKLLDFIKEKTNIIDKEIIKEKEEIKPEIKPEIKKEELSQQSNKLQPVPGPLSSELNLSSSGSGGLKGSKWAGKNRPKSDPSKT